MALSPFPHLWPWIVFWATLAQQGNLYLKYVKLFLRPHAQMYRYLESLTPSSNSRTTVPLSCWEWKIMFQVLSDAVLFPSPKYWLCSFNKKCHPTMQTLASLEVTPSPSKLLHIVQQSCMDFNSLKTTTGRHTQHLNLQSISIKMGTLPQLFSHYKRLKSWRADSSGKSSCWLSMKTWVWIPVRPNALTPASWTRTQEDCPCQASSGPKAEPDRWGFAVSLFPWACVHTHVHIHHTRAHLYTITKLKKNDNLSCQVFFQKTCGYVTHHTPWGGDLSPLHVITFLVIPSPVNSREIVIFCDHYSMDNPRYGM